MVAQQEAHYFGVQEGGMFNTEQQRPDALIGITEKVATAGGTMYVTISVDEGRKPMEVFIRIGKMGETESAHLTGLGRVLSYALRTGSDLWGLWQPGRNHFGAGVGQGTVGAVGGRRRGEGAAAGD